MYIIRTGTVQVFVEKQGKKIPITELGKGQYIGEMSFLTGVKRSADVIAATDILVNEIPADILEDENLGLSSWAVSIAKVLVRRIRTTTEQLSEYLLDHETPDAAESQTIISEQSIPTGKNPQNEQTKRLFLKGMFTQNSVEPIRNKIHELKVHKDSMLILDFSDVIDIDQAGINFIFGLIKSHEVAEHRIRIENMQLIREKVLSIQGLQNILTKTDIPLRHVEKDELLIKQGDLEHVMYVVKNGSFTISRETESGTVVLAKAEKGDVIGEMSLIKEGRRSADVRADRPGTVHVLDVRDFYNNVYNVPRWFIELIRGLTERLRNTNELIVKYESRHEDNTSIEKSIQPMNIIIDSEKPGKYNITGNVSLANFRYILPLMKLEIMKKRKDVTIDFTGASEVGDDAKTAISTLIRKMDAYGVCVHIHGL